MLALFTGSFLTGFVYIMQLKWHPDCKRQLNTVSTHRGTRITKKKEKRLEGGTYRQTGGVYVAIIICIKLLHWQSLCACVLSSIHVNQHYLGGVRLLLPCIHIRTSNKHDQN